MSLKAGERSEPRGVGDLYKLEKTGNGFSPRASVRVSVLHLLR